MTITRQFGAPELDREGPRPSPSAETTAPLYLPAVNPAAPLTAAASSPAPRHAVPPRSWPRGAAMAIGLLAVLVAVAAGSYLVGSEHHGVALTAAPAAAPLPPARPVGPVAPVIAVPTGTPALATQHAAATTTAKPVARATATRPATAVTVSKVDTGSGCGLRAVMAGKFNPACAEFQGYLDPGVSAGRGPNDTDIQNCTAVKSVAECRQELHY